MVLRAHVEQPTGDYGDEQAAMDAYRRAGEARAMALGNRGPIRFNADGSLAEDILEAYSRCGFYVFTGVIGAAELADIESDIESDIDAILERLPVTEGAVVDRSGRPALAVDCKAPTLFWSRPLGDPFGGTDVANGRHPARMFEPKPAADAPAKTVCLILGSLQLSAACLRLYAHPALLGDRETPDAWNVVRWFHDAAAELSRSLDLRVTVVNGDIDQPVRRNRSHFRSDLVHAAGATIAILEHGVLDRAAGKTFFGPAKHLRIEIPGLLRVGGSEFIPAEGIGNVVNPCSTVLFRLPNCEDCARRILDHGHPADGVDVKRFIHYGGAFGFYLFR
jgi:hypothetical protein